MSECCHTEKKKHRSEEEYRSLINRLSRIEGQVRGVKRQVEEEAYCVDILMQVSAIQAALNAGLPANMMKLATAVLFLLVLVVSGRKGEAIIHA